jgi:hypothetical protein
VKPSDIGIRQESERAAAKHGAGARRRHISAGEININLLNLSSHRQSEEDEEIYHENGPIHRDVKHFRCRAEQSDYCRSCCREPTPVRYIRAPRMARKDLPKLPFW